MDDFLARLGVQAVNYAMRCGIALTSTFAVQQCARLLKTVDNKVQHAELRALQRTLDSKIKIISPALDLIEFKSGRGNVFLGSAAALAKALYRDIAALGQRLEAVAYAEERAQTRGGYGAHGDGERRRADLVAVIHDIRSLLARIDGDIPLLQLAITASGESLSAALPPSISPSRLLQASMFLVVGDTQFAGGGGGRPVQIGPSFTLSLYMLFQGHAAPQEPPYGLGEGERKPIWQEVLHKARVRICRTPRGWAFDRRHGYAPTRHPPRLPSASVVPRDDDTQPPAHHEHYAYHLEMVENLDDGRVHGEEEEGEGSDQKARPYDSIQHAGIRESVPIHQIAKIFYTDTGRILNIGSAHNDLDNTSVLLLKRDTAITAPSRTRHTASNVYGAPSDEQGEVDHQLREESVGVGGRREDEDDDGPWRFPRHLDPEWLALEVFAGSDADTDEGDDENGDASDGAEEPSRPAAPLVDGHLAEQMRNMAVSDPAHSDDNAAAAATAHPLAAASAPASTPTACDRTPFGAVASSLSLLEMLVRLTSLQEFQQTAHLSIPDHVLTFFLEETSTTGLRGDARWQARRAAEQRMGFDPFTDSPSR